MMLLRKGKRNQVAMLPTTEIEASVLVSLMKNYKNSHRVVVSSIGNCKTGVIAVLLYVGEEDVQIIIDDTLVERLVHI